MAPSRTPTEDELTSARRGIAQDADLGLNEYLHVVAETCTALMRADVGTVLLAAPTGRLRAAASSIEGPPFDDLFRISAEVGPGVRSFATGRSVDVPDLADAAEPTSALGTAARRHAMRSAHATPLTVQGSTIGALLLFSTSPGAVEVEPARALRALADEALAAFAAARLARTVVDHLQDVLDTRVLIERAKGVLMAVHGISPSVASTRLAAHAVQHRQTTAEVARAVLARTLELPLDEHWSGLGSFQGALVLPPVLIGRDRTGQDTTPAPLDQEIIHLIEDAAEVQYAAGKKRLARRHRAAAASLRRVSGASLSCSADQPVDQHGLERPLDATSGRRGPAPASEPGPGKPLIP